MLNKKNFSMGLTARLAVVLVVSGLASPLAVKYTNTTDAVTLKGKAYTLSQIKDFKNSLLTPSVRNMSLMDTNPRNYNRVMGYSSVQGFDWDSGGGFFGASKKERFIEQINHDANAMIELMAFFRGALQQPDDTSMKEAYSRYLSGYNERFAEHLPYVSPLVATLIANPLEAAVALRDKKKYKGIEVRDFVLNKSGNQQLGFSEFTDTKNYYKHYKEFWIGLIFKEGENYWDMYSSEQPRFKYVGKNWYNKAHDK